MKRGYVRASPRQSQRSQTERLQSYGVAADRLYVESEDEALTDFVRATRPGDQNCVTTLDRLGRNREELRTALIGTLERGGIIVETMTGRTSESQIDLANMVLDAVNALARDHRTHRPAIARKYGRMGGRPKTKDRMSEAEAKAIWMDKDKFPTNAEALAAMPGWSYRMARYLWGAAGRGLGGRPLKRKA